MLAALEAAGFTAMQNEDMAKQLKTVQTLITIAFIVAPISLIFGGIVFSIAALVCAIIAFVKMRHVITPQDGTGSLAKSLYTQSMVALGISAAVTVINAVAFVYVLGMVMTALSTGDFSQIYQMIGGGQLPTGDGGDEASGISIWDRP